MSITWNISLLFHILGQIYNVEISRIRCGQDKESFQINARKFWIGTRSRGILESRIGLHSQSPILIVGFHSAFQSKHQIGNHFKSYWILCL